MREYITDGTSGYGVATGYIASSRCRAHLAIKPCPQCLHQLYDQLDSQPEEPLANNIDEQQITLLDGMRSARDAAYRYAQSKHDRATLMRIQADALQRESDEIVAEINEGVPAKKSK